MNNEEWRDIKGFEGLYQVSNLGRVKRVFRQIFDEETGYYRCYKEKIMKISKEYKGVPYLRVKLTNNSGNGKLYRVHRLVAEAFCDNPDPENFNCVNHKDENKLNNRADNLEWCTNEYNFRYSYERHPEKYGDFQKKKVRCIETGKIYDSLTECARDFNNSETHISACCRGRIHSTRGHHFEYVEDELS